MAIIDTQKQTVEIKCPNCKEIIDQELEITIYEPSIDIDVEAL